MRYSHHSKTLTSKRSISNLAVKDFPHHYRYPPIPPLLLRMRFERIENNEFLIRTPVNNNWQFMCQANVQKWPGTLGSHLSARIPAKTANPDSAGVSVGPQLAQVEKKPVCHSGVHILAVSSSLNIQGDSVREDSAQSTRI
jgi:hypothetical protein